MGDMTAAWRARLGVAVATIGMAASSLTALAQPSSSVMVNIDQPSASETVRSGQPLFIGGWAADMASGASVQTVEVFLDGPAGAGQRIGTANYGQPRSDVAASTGRADWRNTGFGIDWAPRDLTGGQHMLYIYAQSSSGASGSASVAFTFDQRSAASPQNPIWVRTAIGWEIDTGGPGIRLDRFPDIDERSSR